MNFLFHNLKNHINRDPLCDWFDKMHKINNYFKKDSPHIFQIETYAQKIKYKRKFVSYFKDEPFYYENINHKQIIDLISGKKECVIIGGNLYNHNYNITVKPDIIIHRNLFKKYFPQVVLDLPEYIIIDILYKNIHFNSSKTDILNEGSIYYHKCKMFVASNALNINDYGYFFGKEYRHKNKTLPKKEWIGRFSLTNELSNSINDALNWLKRLDKYYDEWTIYPKPCIKELYPNMNHKHICWTDEKTILANLIKEITLVWNISYNKRCMLLDKGITEWDDPLLLSNIYNLSIKDNYRFHIQNKMIHLQLQDDIKIEPRKIKKYDFINVINNRDNSIILDIESVCDYTEKANYFTNIDFNDPPKICIIGTIITETNIFKDFTIRYLKPEEERIIICHWLSYLENNLDTTKKIKIYHWGNAEKVYLNYMKNKYFELDFPEFEMIDLLIHFKNEPIVIKGCFGYGLKEIVKCLYDLKLIPNKWKDNMDGLEAMIKLKEFSDKAISKNIPIKRFSEVKDIIYYNYIDCRVILDILNMLEKMI